MKVQKPKRWTLENISTNKLIHWRPGACLFLYIFILSDSASKGLIKNFEQKILRLTHMQYQLVYCKFTACCQFKYLYFLPLYNISPYLSQSILKSYNIFHSYHNFTLSLFSFFFSLFFSFSSSFWFEIFLDKQTEHKLYTIFLKSQIM